jgi:hypothetical protein
MIQMKFQNFMGIIVLNKTTKVEPSERLTVRPIAIQMLLPYAFLTIRSLVFTPTFNDPS